MMTGHNIPLLCVTIVTPLAFCVVAGFNYLLATSSSAIFESDTTTISDKYNLEITPAGWTFSIWGVIYLWQAVWIIYVIINLFRKTDKGPLYTHPILQNVPFYVSYIINLGLNITWLLIFDREYLEASFAVLFMMVITLAIPLVLSYRALDQNIDDMICTGLKKDVWFTRLFVQNGLSIYVTWCTIATLLNFGIVLAYVADGISNQNASTAVLSILGVVILVFYTTDWFFLDRWTRYTFTPYLVLIVGLTGSITENYNEGSRNTVLTIVLLGLTGFGALVKCFFLIWRHLRYTKDGVLVTSGGLHV